MAFDHRPLLNLAEELAQMAAADANEIKLRAAVGRAYYAVFLAAREKFGVTATKDVHAEVGRAVGRSLGRIASDKLFAFKSLREAADYQFPPQDPAHSDWTKNWADAKLMADHLLERFE